jgi:hypothetical protein
MVARYSKAGSIKTFNDVSFIVLNCLRVNEKVCYTNKFKIHCLLIRYTRRARFRVAQNKKCDAVEPDNVDCYQNKCVQGQSENALRPYQLMYNKWQTEQIHALGTLSEKSATTLCKSKFDLSHLKFHFYIQV